jgi:hypothetical protein
MNCASITVPIFSEDAALNITYLFFPVNQVDPVFASSEAKKSRFIPPRSGAE